VPLLDSSRAGDVAVPAFEVVIIDVVDLEDIKPTIGIVGLDKAVALPKC
jgi:hypothetical protein